jgi:hypothetical protein
MSGAALQAKRILGVGDGKQASVNAYLALIGVVGVVGWAGTALFAELVSDEITLVGWTGIVIAGWVVLTGGRLLLGGLHVSRAESYSAPFMVWLVIIAGAFAANVYGATVSDPALAMKLMCMPWLVGMGVGYLLTGLMVTRGWVYLAAGVAGLGLFGVFVTQGLSPPSPQSFIILGLFNSVPMFVDASLGGRELTPSGQPRVAVETGDTAATVSVNP